MGRLHTDSSIGPLQEHASVEPNEATATAGICILRQIGHFFIGASCLTSDRTLKKWSHTPRIRAHLKTHSLTYVCEDNQQSSRSSNPVKPHQSAQVLFQFQVRELPSTSKYGWPSLCLQNFAGPSNLDPEKVSVAPAPYESLWLQLAASS